MSSTSRGLYRLRKPGGDELAALAAAQRDESLSYGPIGMSLRADAPPGFHTLQVRRDIGTGPERFAAARSAIVGWAGHRRAGAILGPERPELVVGADVAVAVPVWPLWVVAACRIVEVLDEPDRFGFAYGTLPQHPESGEESFLVVRDQATDRVSLEVTAHSHPTARLAKLGGPVGRAFQRFMANRYLDGFEHGTSGDRAA